MIRYPLESLLQVRKLREEKAERELSARRKDVDRAREEVKRRKEELERYHQWRLSEEDRLYREVQGTVVTMSDLDDLRYKIGLLREEEEAKKQSIVEAQAELDAAIKRLKEAENYYKRMVVEREKIEKHKESWEEEARKLEAEEADKEMDEFAERLSGHHSTDEEWDVYDEDTG